MKRKCVSCQSGEMVFNFHLSTDDYPVEVCNDPDCRRVETSNINSGWMEVQGPIDWNEKCPICGKTALQENGVFSCGESGFIAGGKRAMGGVLL